MKQQRFVINFLLLLAMLIGLSGYPQDVGMAQEILAGTTADTLGIATGVHLRPSDTYGRDLHAFNTQVGKNSAILMYFTDFFYGFDSYLYEKITQQVPPGEMPVLMLTVLPTSGRQDKGCDKNYDGFIGYDALLSGKCDNFIRKFATSIAQKANTRFLIRFAHEMNLSDSSYWPSHSGKSPDAYVQLYRHFYQVFTAAQDAAGGRNAEFVWSPNYFSHPAESWNYYDHYYPGDSYVDWIGLSGYNWYPYNSQPNRSFKQLFGDLDGTDAYYSDAGFHPGILYDLSCRYAKPIILAEFGAAHNADTVQQKKDWITDAYNRLPTHPFVRAVVWFNDYSFAGNSIDFRVTQPGTVPSEITNAYKNAVQMPQFRSALPEREAATPPMTYCWTDAGKAGQAVFRLSRSIAMAENNSNTHVSLMGMLFTGDPEITFASLPPGFSASVIDDSLVAPWGEANLRFTIDSNVSAGTYAMVVRVNSLQGVFDLPFQVKVVDQLYTYHMPLLSR